MININKPSPGDIKPSVLPGDTSDSRNSSLIIFGRYAYQVKMVCQVQELLLSLAGLFSYLPCIDFIGECLCAQ